MGEQPGQTENPDIKPRVRVSNPEMDGALSGLRRLECIGRRGGQ